MLTSRIISFNILRQSIKLCENRSDVLRRAACIRRPFIIGLYEQIREAGHAKWQNIASTKSKNDILKCRTISRYVLQVRRAIISNNRQADPKLNSRLADVLSEAYRMNVPKATLERAIARAVDIKIYPKSVEIQGPGGCAIIAQCETENANSLRRDIKKIVKKFDSNVMPDESLMGMFQSRGFIRASLKTKDLREVDSDFAEDAAILANAEEVSIENYPNAEDENLASAWVFLTDANNLGPCRGELEKLGLQILSHELCLVPYRELDLGQQVYEQVIELCEKLQEHEQVVEVFHNVKPAGESS